MVNKARLIENMADLVKDKRIDGITNMKIIPTARVCSIVVDIEA